MNENDDTLTGPLATVDMVNGGIGGGAIAGQYFIYKVNGLELNGSSGPRYTQFQMDDAGTNLSLRPGVTFDYERGSTYEVVLRHHPGTNGVPFYGDVTITVTVRDVPESPEIQLPDGPVFYFIQNSGSTSRSFSLFDSDLVVTRTEVSAKVGYQLSDDRFELKQQFPLYNRDSFGDFETRQFYKIVAKNGHSFNVGETINLTITALDNDGLAPVQKTVTINIVTVDGSWAGRNIMTGTANQDDVFVVDTTPNHFRSFADTISDFEDTRDKVKFSTDVSQIWVQRENVGGSTNILIRNSNDHTVTDNILAVLNNFDGIFDHNDLSDDTITVTALPDIS